MKAEQLYIAGTEPPPDPVKNPEIDDALDRWLVAKKKQSAASEASKIRHESLLELMAASGIERYPFHDESGRKKYVVAAKEPKARVINAPSKKQEGRDVDARRERAEREAEERVEVRRVPRAEVADEIGESDPFAATRRAMEDLDEDPTVTTSDGATHSVPKRSRAKRGK